MRLLLTHAYFLSEDPERAPDHEALCAAGHSLSVLAPARQRIRCRYLRLDFRLARRAVRHFGCWSAGGHRNLRQPDDAAQCAGYRRARARSRMEGDPGRSGAGQLCRRISGAGADLIVAGEGEYAHRTFAGGAAGSGGWPSIPGIMFRAPDGSVFRTGPAQLIPNLDAQPWPDRERVDIPRYLKVWREHHGTGSVSVITARGCPYHCNWCSHSVYGKTHRRRSPQSVADEVAWIEQRYQPDMLWMADDVFTIHHGWIFEYAAEMTSPRPEHSVRMHHARRSSEPAHRRNSGRRWDAFVSGSDRKAVRSAFSTPCSAA